MGKQIESILFGAMLGTGITALVTSLSFSQDSSIVKANTCESIVIENVKSEGFSPMKDKVRTACLGYNNTLLDSEAKGKLATRTYFADVEGYRTWHSAEIHCPPKLREAIKPKFGLDPKTEAFICINSLNYESITPESLNMETLYRLDPEKAATEYTEWLNR